MCSKQFFTLAELTEALDNDPNFLEQFDDEECDGIDIVELPPEKVDVVSDEEDFDENELEDTIPRDVPGTLEIQSNLLNEEMNKAGPSGLAQKAPKTRSKKELVKSVWKKTKPDFYKIWGDDQEISKRQEKIKNDLSGMSAVQIFEKLLTEDIMLYIVMQSVTYATQNNRHSFTFSVDCLRKFIGFLILTGYHSLPQEQMYWCEDEDVNIECVRKCMSRNRYLEIKRNLHLNDNSKINQRQKTYKIAPLLEKMNNQFLQFGVFAKNISIDEQMIRYYGHHFLKQFIRGKPIRFGFKQWAMCCAETGFCFHAELYEGKQVETFPVEGVGASVILKNISLVENPMDHVFYFDNFFTSHTLMKILAQKKVRATGTVRYNRTNKCSFKKDDEMKKEIRGTYDYRFDENNDIFAVTWKDNNIVKVLSNHQGLEPIHHVSRYSRTDKKPATVPQPKCISDYNKYMGGVDKLDWLVNKYRIKIRGKKWYFPIITNLIDVIAVNAHVLYEKANWKIPFLDFKRAIARTYLATPSISDPKRFGRPSLRKLSSKRVPEDIRKSRDGHFIERTEGGKQRKCAVCKKNARKQCQKCNVGIHVNCMQKWHK